ncbi:hypothetical protein BC937DRAFT_88165 [Endogone sp. FLAS-F59071]|nr:hypothetical protein BC937DRAFT_88165 [Endogone sp. FLAS-F59071]|eukprot:RUS18926.1 hypothetical protein BC937DRAFT_88165 [Endogone sp. FLAS-F59071]
MIGATIRRWLFELWDQFTAEAKEKQGETTKEVGSTSSTVQPHDTTTLAATEANSSIPNGDLIRSLAGTDINLFVPA